MKRQAWISIITAALIIGFGGILLSLQSPLQAQDDQQQSLEHVEEKSWVEKHLANFHADEDNNQAIYLSAVQIAEIYELQGKPGEAVPILRQIANEAPNQPIRNSVRRLIINIQIAQGEYQDAEKNLRTIISETLLQM